MRAPQLKKGEENVPEKQEYIYRRRRRRGGVGGGNSSSRIILAHDLWLVVDGTSSIMGMVVTIT